MESKKDKWQKIFGEWTSSGLGRKAYCQKQGIPVTTFDYWRRRIREDEHDQNAKGLVRLPVVLQQAAPSGFGVIVKCCGSRKAYPMEFRLPHPQQAHHL